MTEHVAAAEAVTARDRQRAASDFRKSIVLLVAVILGNMAGVNTALTYTMGVFMGTLHQQFGWSRADISLSMTWYTLVALFGTVLIGRVADRLNPGRLAAVSMLAFGVALLVIPPFVHDIKSFWIAYVLFALVGLGTSPAVLIKPVIAAFAAGRGLAIGIALSGAGIGGFLAPRLAAAWIERGGWKFAYAGMGCTALVVAAILWVVLGARPGTPSVSPDRPVKDLDGVRFGEAFKRRDFWFLSGISMFGGLGLAGPAAHLIPFLCDHAKTPVEAASLASMLGLASIAGRIVTGYTLDRIDAPAVGFPFLLAGCLGVTLLLLLDVRAATAGIFLLGFAIGSEIDLLAYFTSRYFGLRAHATIFGWNYGMVAFGAATAPVIVGALRDHQGNYSVSLALSTAALAVAAFICLLLGRYRFPARVAPAP